MKIRMDFVTNSSSSSFVVSLGVEDIHGKRTSLASYQRNNGDEWEEFFEFCDFTYPNYDYESDTNTESIPHLELRAIVDEKLKSIDEYTIISELVSYLRAIRSDNLDSITNVNDRVIALFIREYMKRKGLDVKSLIQYCITTSNSAHGECFDSVLGALPPWQKIMDGELSDEKYAEMYNTDVDSVRVYRDIKNGNIGMGEVTKIEETVFSNRKTETTYSVSEEYY